MVSLGYVGRIWLNGEFGLSREKGFDGDKPKAIGLTEEERWNSEMLRQHGLEACLEYRNSLDGEKPGQNVSSDTKRPGFSRQGGASTLGLSLVAKSHRAKRGQRGISRYGAKLVRNGSFLLQKENRVNRISFLTLTLPNVSREESEVICRNWAEIVRILVQRLRRTLKRSELPGEIIGCTEIQESRVMLTGVFGLHLHMLFVGRKRGHSWALTPTEIKMMWKDALSPYLSSSVESYDWRAVENIEPLKAQKTEYLGKYMSKGLKACQKIHAMFPGLDLPAAWFMCTNSLRDRVKSGTLRVSGEMGRVIVEMVEGMGEKWVKYCSPIRLKLNGGEVSIGHVGRLTKRGRDEIALYIESSRIHDEGASLIIINSDMKGA